MGAEGQTSIDQPQNAGRASRRHGRFPSIGRLFWGMVLAVLIRLFFRVEVRGSKNLPKDGAGIAYYNHIHWTDPPLICGKMRRYAVPLTKIEISRWPFISWMLTQYHVVYVTRGAVDREALRKSWEVLADGDIIVISPEGHRSEDGGLQQAKDGLAFIARRNPEAWLMPVAVQGTPAFHLSFPEILRRAPVTITYGRAFRFRWPDREAAVKGKVERQLLRDMTDEAMVQLAWCLPEEMHGDYAGTDPQQHQWLEFLDQDEIESTAPAGS